MKRTELWRRGGKVPVFVGGGSDGSMPDAARNLSSAE
jgi:hypothetical protein